ncbi:helix-turn-helix transcriptional regulator [Corynebacterium auriscanis]|uniref:helix-turn-helix domain-containing protein n=1 Tax=Corynebacterium auriscanis TaxID=99807 RepID=UPI0031F724F4
MTTSASFSGRVPTWDIIDRVIKARRTAGLKQAELAEMIGIARTTLAGIEQGKRTPRRTEIIAIAFATGVDLGWLETGKTPTENNPGGGEEWAIRDSNPEPAD